MSHDHLIGMSKKQLAIEAQDPARMKRTVAKKMPGLIKSFDAYYKKNPDASTNDAIAYMKAKKT
jgi:hypothetical protein